MATGFHEVQFPTNISYGSTGGPEFSTEVIQLASGHEQRNIRWTYPLERWQVAYGIKNQGDLDVLRTFFYARRGRAYGFRFKNHDDYQATNQEIGEGDGSETAFQLVKTYTSEGETLTRKITKPVVDTVVIYVDDVEQGSGVDVDYTTGIVTFESPPGDGEIITADFEFDIPVRFDTDYLSINLTDYGARAADNVPVVEIRQ
jgi:uncharacterized protein (TIGR02217 family)